MAIGFPRGGGCGTPRGIALTGVRQRFSGKILHDMAKFCRKHNSHFGFPIGFPIQTPILQGSADVGLSESILA
jgi:hypothetical protein